MDIAGKQRTWVDVSPCRHQHPAAPVGRTRSYRSNRGFTAQFSPSSNPWEARVRCLTTAMPARPDLRPRRPRAQELVKRAPAFMYCLVADENVYNLYGATFEEKFRATGKTLFVKVAHPKPQTLSPKS